jgi:hypothetical protein
VLIKQWDVETQKRRSWFTDRVHTNWLSKKLLKTERKKEKEEGEQEAFLNKECHEDSIFLKRELKEWLYVPKFKPKNLDRFAVSTLVFRNIQIF